MAVATKQRVCIDLESGLLNLVNEVAQDSNTFVDTESTLRELVLSGLVVYFDLDLPEVLVKAGLEEEAETEGKAIRALERRLNLKRRAVE